MKFEDLNDIWVEGTKPVRNYYRQEYGVSEERLAIFDSLDRALEVLGGHLYPADVKRKFMEDIGCEE